MTVRSTMADIIARTRLLIYDSAGTAQVFTDQQIQDTLDRHRLDVYNAPLVPIETWAASGLVTWLTYRAAHSDYEATSSGGSATFIVQDSTGAVSGTANWTADYTRGVVTFGANQHGTAYYVTGASYDLYGASADLLEAWAARVALAFDFTTDGQTFNRSQQGKALSGLAQQYRRQQRPMTIQMVRDDVRPSISEWPLRPATRRRME